MISAASIYMAFRTLMSSFFDSLSGRNRKGIRNRTILAFVLAVVGIAVDTWFVYACYDYIPSYIETHYGWDYLPTMLESKSVFWHYEISRIISLAVFTAAGWLVYKFTGKSITGLRIFCLLEETANLIILTCVGMSIVILCIALGDNSQKLSELWEVVTIYVWFTILFVEFIFDLLYFRKQKSLS